MTSTKTSGIQADQGIWTQVESDVANLLTWAKSAQQNDRVERLRREVALSNNGWTATHDLEAANVLEKEGFVVRKTPLSDIPRYAVYSAAAQAALAKTQSEPSQARTLRHEIDYEALILDRQELQIMDF